MRTGLMASVVVGVAGLAGVGCSGTPEGRVASRQAEVGCGLCRFGDDASSCELMVRMDGVVYPVDGAGIDDFGDAHAPDGLCEATRTAVVSGRIDGGRFVAESIELVP